MNLYLITTLMGEYYVLATDPTAACEALAALKRFLDKYDFGLFPYREVTNIKCLAADAFPGMKGVDLNNARRGIIIDAEKVGAYIHLKEAEKNQKANPLAEESLTLVEWMEENEVGYDQDLKVYVEGYTLDYVNNECDSIIIHYEELKPPVPEFDVIPLSGDIRYYGKDVTFAICDDRPFIYASLNWLINDPDGPEKEEEDMELMISEGRLEIIEKHAEEI